MRKPAIVEKAADENRSIAHIIALLQRAEKDRDKFRDDYAQAMQRLEVMVVERDQWKREAMTLRAEKLPVGRIG